LQVVESFHRARVVVCCRVGGNVNDEGLKPIGGL
jgi:hypothetical protein